MSATDQLSLVNRRNTQKGKLQNTLNRINGHDSNPISFQECQVIQASLDSIEAKVESIQDQLCTWCETDDALQTQMDAMDSIYSMLIESKTNLNKIRDSLAPVVLPSRESQGQESSQLRSSIRLPKLELSTFSGNYEDWLQFRDQFTATIKDNVKLSGCEKLQYLKSSLKDDALKMVASFPITNDNFHAAWESLESRYNNTRELVYSIIKQVMNQPKLTSESVVHLRRLVDTTNQCVRLLKNLGRQVDNWSDMLVYIITEKLDGESKKEWTRQLTSSSMPTFSQLMEFLERHIRGLSALGNQSRTTRESKVHAATQGNKCGICSEQHAIYKCPTFLSYTPQQRVTKIRESNRCINCLNTGHIASACFLRGNCRQCGRKHNSLLHLGQDSSRGQTGSSSTVQAQTISSNFASGVGVLLATAIVEVMDSCGRHHQCRVFLDPGSETSFVTEACLKRLGLTRTNCNTMISGIGSSSVGRVKGKVMLDIKSRLNQFRIRLDALILPKVTGSLPSFYMKDSWTQWSHIHNLKLADEQFYHPRDVDILIGADATARIYTGNRLLGAVDEPVAVSSEFGWILQGPVGVSTNSDTTYSNHSIRVHSCTVHTDELIQRFWESESIPEKQIVTTEEQEAENHFIKNHSRDSNGRYIVPLPFNSNLLQLGSSRQIALRRFLATERRLSHRPDWKQQYSNFMQQYLDLGHMEEVPSLEIGEESGEHPITTFYLPHHFVLKDDSTTTKFRVVFDGSCASATGMSLNKCLLVGPTIQPDMWSHLLRFRKYPIAIKADIAKMYRQFLVSSQNADMQRILWRWDPNQEIKEFRLKTVTYGTASAPFSATRCLEQITVDEGAQYPLAVTAVKENFYVDDLLTGASTLEGALELQSQLTTLLSKAKLDIRKWDSNCPEFLSRLNSDLVESAHSFDVSSDIHSRALGVHWNAVTDQLYFRDFHFEREPPRLTRRIILSEMSRVFDPLGLISPFTINIKIFFQTLWSTTNEFGLKLSWDDEVPQSLLHYWKLYKLGLSKLSSIKVPRYLFSENTDGWELHGFSDASVSAYSCVAYIRSLKGDQPVDVRLIAAKTKVAPLKAQSIPRLELHGAHLLAKLISSIQSALKVQIQTYCWTDSQIVLTWISAPSRRWNTFVSNRVSAIQELLPSATWDFVPGVSNPADCASRGISLDELQNHHLWWEGAEFLHSLGIPQHQPPPILDMSQLEERKSSMVTNKNVFWELLLAKYSNLTTLIRVIAWIKRFKANATNSTGPEAQHSKTQCLTTLELREALLTCIRLAQSEDFEPELRQLQTKKSIGSTSRILSLNPVLENGIICAKGRLSNSQLPRTARQPFLLCGRSYFSKLVINHFHLRLFHGTESLVMAALRREFWIIGGRNSIKGVLRACVRCRRSRGKTLTQMMGNLPSPRVCPSSPFTHTGIDYAGPFTLQTISGRGKKQFKAYFCVFICFAVKAVHIEYVTSMTTEAFIGTLKRFIARRGKPSHIYSDCGSNFIGANEEFKKFMREQSVKNKISQFLAGESVQWHFNPPSAPHQGGLWEAAVKSAKRHIHRVIGAACLTLEEFATLLAQVEAILNSRPLHPLSSNVEDLDALTPGHFLIGKPLVSLPELNHTATPGNKLTRWTQQQQMQQRFWKRWSTEYLVTLQQRVKWKRGSNMISIGDLVSIKDDCVPPLQWKLGRVIELHTGTDGHTRVVTLKTAKGIIKRPVVKLVLILTETEASSSAHTN